MAAKIAVLEAQQELSDAPVRHVKKCVAAHLVRKALARQVSKRLIQMVAIREAMQILARSHEPIIVPELLPPRGPEGLLIYYPAPSLESF